jgi:nitrogen fixation-related uncharacterized protein
LYGADTTWIAIAAAILMGLSGVCLFIFAVKRDHFRDFEDAKYQVFWSDIEAPVESKEKHDSASKPE